MKSIIVILAIVGLAGCVVAPYRPAPVYQPTQEVVEYPQYESAYLWDPVATAFFFVFAGHRYYMDRGWGYRSHGAPRGHYHR